VSQLTPFSEVEFLLHSQQQVPPAPWDLKPTSFLLQISFTELGKKLLFCLSPCRSVRWRFPHPTSSCLGIGQLRHRSLLFHHSWNLTILLSSCFSSWPPKD